MSFISPQRSDIRSQQYSQDLARRKRESEGVSLRRQAREECIQKRRLMSTQYDELFYAEALQQIASYNNLIKSVLEPSQLEGVTGLQKLLSVSKPPITEIIESGAVTTMISFLNHPNEDIQYMSLWAITNVAAGRHEHAMYLYEQDTIPVIVSIIQHSSSSRIREQACWALGNLAGDCPELRDKALESSAMCAVLELLKQTDNRVNMLKTATWTLSNFCRGRPPPKFELIKDAVPVAARLIYSTDRDVEVDALWTLAFLSEGINVNQEAVAHDDICKRLVTLLSTNEIRLIVPSIRTIGNLMSGDDNVTQRVLDNGVLQVLPPLLQHAKTGVRKEACWTVSNVLAGVPAQIKLVVDAGLIDIILERLHDDREDIQREAAWCISNAVSGSSAPLIVEFVQKYNVIPEIVERILTNKESRLVESTLDAIIRILRVGHRLASSAPDTKNIYLEQFEMCGAYNILCELQQHEEQDIYDKAKNILEEFWPSEFEEEDNQEEGLDYAWS